MTMLTAASAYDAVIIGGGIGGLAAACHLARSGAKTLVLEAREIFGGCAETSVLTGDIRAPLLSHVVFALDPQMVSDLRLRRYGLSFAQADMKTVALRPGGEALVLPGASLWQWWRVPALSPSDGAAFRRFRWTVRGLARLLRPFWTGEIESVEPEARTFGFDTIVRRLRLNERQTGQFAQLTKLSAASYLDHWFESDALKAALAFDAGLTGASPGEPGTALALVCRLAQVSRRIKGATSQVKGGPGALAAALVAAAEAAGVELRANGRVCSILVEEARAAGVVLTGGEIIRSGVVISNLDAHETLRRLVPPEAIGFGAAANLPAPARVAEAKLLLALNGPPPFAGLERDILRGRIIIAERPESSAEAKGAAAAGQLPAELVMEVTVPTMADASLAPEGSHVLSALIRYLPVSPAGGWASHRIALEKCAIAALEIHAPGLKDRVAVAQLLTPDDIVRRYGGTAGGVADQFGQILTSYGERVRTPLPGLFLCGSSAEPLSALSGRAGRFAAVHALASLRDTKRRPS